MATDQQARQDLGRANPPVRTSSALVVHDRLEDSFPLLDGESQWLMTLLADELARILADD